jgi:hypothetical protein
MLEWFSMYEVVSEYAKSILASTENTPRVFCIHGEFADRHKIEPTSTNFRPKPKKFSSFITFQDDQMGKKSHATFPLRIPGLNH